MNRRRKSWGVNRNGCPAASVTLVPSNAPLIHSRRVAAGMARCSIPNRRWNSSGIGGFQTRSWES